MAIPGGAINAGTIDELRLADEAVTNAKIAVDAIQGDVIAASAITETKIGPNSISTGKIQAGAVTAGVIAAGTITATEIASNAITATKINAGAVTSDKITVSTLDAISANMGSITAGTITSATLRTQSSGQRVEMNSQGLVVHGTPGGGPITQSIQFKSTADGSTDGYLAPHGSGGVQVGGDLRLNADVVPVNNGSGNVGDSVTEFLASYIRTMNTDVIDDLGSGVQILPNASTSLGFYGATPITKPSVSGARDDPEAALADLLNELATLGLIANSTTAT